MRGYRRHGAWSADGRTGETGTATCSDRKHERKDLLENGTPVLTIQWHARILQALTEPRKKQSGAVVNRFYTPKLRPEDYHSRKPIRRRKRRRRSAAWGIEFQYIQYVWNTAPLESMAEAMKITHYRKNPPGMTEDAYQRTLP
jgi:hypothetical protein